MYFQDVISTVESVDNKTMLLPKGWGQGRAIYGGMATAVTYARLKSAAAEGQSLRSLAVSFVGPLDEGTASCEVRTLRQGKSVTQAYAELSQAGEVKLGALATFGAGRVSGIRWEGVEAVTIPAPEACYRLPADGSYPEFTRNFDYRFGNNSVPFSGTQGRDLAGWVRFKGGDHQATIEDLLGLVDAWPPVLAQNLSQIAPISSLTWTIEFVEPLPARCVADWWRYQARTEYAADGYGHCKATLWDCEGRLVALSRQTVVVFA